mmetsp:Transcript_28560/g.86246  ORF Transcript_28560/g.86246 Transcript_28560/m.86246 type:complete len:349 (+) Transcript_28560:14-1060(+)
MADPSRQQCQTIAQANSRRRVAGGHPAGILRTARPQAPRSLRTQTAAGSPPSHAASHVLHVVQGGVGAGRVTPVRRPASPTRWVRFGEHAHAVHMYPHEPAVHQADPSVVIVDGPHHSAPRPAADIRGVPAFRPLDGQAFRRGAEHAVVKQEILRALRRRPASGRGPGAAGPRGPRGRGRQERRLLDLGPGDDAQVAAAARLQVLLHLQAGVHLVAEAPCAVHSAILPIGARRVDRREGLGAARGPGVVQADLPLLLPHSASSNPRKPRAFVFGGRREIPLRQPGGEAEIIGGARRRVDRAAPTVRQRRSFPCRGLRRGARRGGILGGSARRRRGRGASRGRAIVFRL